MKFSKPIAVGRTAEVYSWSENKIIKLFNEGWSKNVVEAEYQTSKLVSDLGLEVPEVYEIVDHKDRYGIIYQKLIGKSMLQMMLAKPYQIRKYGKQLAELAVSMHDQKVNGLPSQKEKLHSGIMFRDYLTQREKKFIINEFKDLPESSHLCHGDFHPDNVIITDSGPKIIDWLTVAQGNPTGDFARSMLLLTIGTPPSGFIKRTLTNIFRSLFHNSFSRNYLQNREIEKDELEKWELPTLAYRLNDDNITEERKFLIEKIRYLINQQSP